MNMKVFIPLADGQDIPYEVYHSIYEQNLLCDIVPCSTPGVIRSNQNIISPEYKQARLKGEVDSRNKILDTLPLYREIQFFGMQDRDIIHLNNFNYYFGIRTMLENPEIVAVCMPKLAVDINPPADSYLFYHVRISCFIGRTDFFLNGKFRFHYEETIRNKEDCICHAIGRDIRKNGRMIRYIGKIPMIRELSTI